jgi:hypothetical protein
MALKLLSSVRWLLGGFFEGVVDMRGNGGGYDVNGVWKVADVALKYTAQASAERPTNPP